MYIHMAGHEMFEVCYFLVVCFIELKIKVNVVGMVFLVYIVINLKWNKWKLISMEIYNIHESLFVYLFIHFHKIICF